MAKKEDLNKEDSYAIGMLEFLKVKHPDQIKTFLKAFDPSKQTWIVSDLKSKQEIQAECLSRFGFYADDSILRISDFWRIWIRRLRPAMQIVASDFIKSLVQIFLINNGAVLELSENDQSTLEHYVQELAPIILHPESDSLLSEWFESQPVEKKWQKWYKIAHACLVFIVNEKKVIDVKWSAAYLQSLELQDVRWPSEIIVDLGTELTSVEMGLLKVLAQNQRVLIHVPDPEWHSRFPFLLKTYTENFGYGEVKEISSTPAASPCRKEFTRLSTQLAEVKFAVAKVRRWLDEGVPLKNIAIIALQIEDYWPALEMYLKEEGIPTQKDTVAAVNSLADVQAYLAHLKSLTNEVSFESLQQTFFQSAVKPELRFENFKSLFHQLYDEEDLKRDEKIQALFYRKIDLVNAVSRDDFISILLRVWSAVPENKNSAALFELLFKDFLSQSLDTPLKFSSWFQFFKARLSHKEMKISYAGENGIQILSLMSAQMNHADHRVYLGLYEEAFRMQKKSVIPLSDIEILKNQFDLAIPYPEESHLDFNLRWQVEADCKQLFLTVPHLSFGAEPLTPCLYFLENKPQSELVSPELTRVDQRQKNFAVSAANDVGDYGRSVSALRLRQDLLGAQLHVKHSVFNQLAASEVETHAQCSFKLLASKGFRLRELPEVSIDLDPRQKGTLVHALFEYLIQALQESRYNLDETRIFLQQKREELGLFTNEDAFWSVQLNKLLSLSEKFKDFEKSRLQHFRAMTELSFELHFDPIAKSFAAQKTESSIAIRGRIDRLDQRKNSDEVLIYDYKSSGGQASNFAKWMSHYQFQLLIYIFAVEVTLFETADVKGALYYLYKNFDVTKGLVERKFALEMLGYATRAKASIADTETKEAVQSQFIDFLSESFRRLQNGEFTALPFDPEICYTCDWRKMCRAKHLM